MKKLEENCGYISLDRLFPLTDSVKKLTAELFCTKGVDIHELLMKAAEQKSLPQADLWKFDDSDAQSSLEEIIVEYKEWAAEGLILLIVPPSACNRDTGHGIGIISPTDLDDPEVSFYLDLARQHEGWFYFWPADDRSFDDF